MSSIFNNIRCYGNLVVDGTTTSINTENLNVADTYIYINKNYTENAEKKAGIVANVFPTSFTDTIVGPFSPGVAGISDPTVITTNAGIFAPNAIIQITGANDESNNGIYEVVTHSIDNILTIRGVGINATVEPFVQTNFKSSSVPGGIITTVAVSVIRSGAGGVWETGYGSTYPITYKPLLNTDYVPPPPTLPPDYIESVKKYTDGLVHYLGVNGQRVNTVSDGQDVILPNATENGRIHTVINVGDLPVTIKVQFESTDFIETETRSSIILPNKRDRITLQYIDGVWYIV